MYLVTRLNACNLPVLIIFNFTFSGGSPHSFMNSKTQIPQFNSSQWNLFEKKEQVYSKTRVLSLDWLLKWVGFWEFMKKKSHTLKYIFFLQMGFHTCRRGWTLWTHRCACSSKHSKVQHLISLYKNIHSFKFRK